MKYLSTLAIALLMGVSSFAFAQNPGDNLFSGTQVHTINLRFQQTDYWEQLDYYYNRGDEVCIPVQVIIDNVTYDSVGVRLKGNSSYTYPGRKKSIRLAFDEFVDSLRWDGLKSVHLNNMWGDPSFMREKLYLDFCRDAGIAAPRANYVRLFINDTLFALYSLVEHVDKTFLESRFGNKGGDLFKAVDGIGDSDTLISDFSWYGSSEGAYTSRYELKTDGSLTAWPQLIGFIDTLAHSTDLAADFQRKTAFQQLCAAFATDNLFGNLDSYANSGRNFYTYFHGKSKQMHWIIWDAGLSFGAYSGGVASPERMSITHVVDPAMRPLLGAILFTPELKQQYLQKMCELKAEYFRTDKLFPHIDSVSVLIRPFVVEDQRKMYTMQQFETNISMAVDAAGGGTVRKPGLKSFLDQRATQVRDQLAALGITCGLGVEPSATLLVQHLSLAQNYPNPFNPSTTIDFVLPVTAPARLTVYDALGRSVTVLVHGVQSSGPHSVRFDAESLPSGLYRYEIVQGNARAVRTLTLLR